MDTHVFASLAQVKILVVPVGPISQSTFKSYAADIRSFDTIRLGDLPENKDDKARFMPRDALQAGHIHLSFPAHPPPSSHMPLSLLRPSHFPLAVIGVASCARPDILPDISQQFTESLQQLFPEGSIFPLAKNCFVFEEGDSGTNLNVGDNFPGLIVIPGIMGNKKLYIGTLMADLCSNILGEFAVLYQTLESPLGNEALNSSMMPVLPSWTDMPVPLDNDSRNSAPSFSSQPDTSKSAFALAASPGRRNSLASNRQPSLGVPTSNVRKRLSGIGVSSSLGRLFKVLADLFLLSGRTEDAAIWYNESLQIFKPSQDLPWQASALEGLATIAILDAWSAGQGLQTSTSSTKEPWTEVSEKLVQAAGLYNRTPIGDGDQIFSLLAYMHCCCVLRHAALLFAIWSAKGWGPLAFTTMLHPGPSPFLPPTLARGDGNSWSHLERLSTISGIPRTSISTLITQVHGPWLLHLGPRERIAVLEAAATLYSGIGYRRKESYLLREILGCILDLIVCGREEDAATTPTSAALETRGQVGIRLSESTEGNESILQLLKYVCRVLGINLDAVKMIEVENDSEPPLDQKNYDEDIIDGYREPYGWPELQVGVIREAVAVAQALPDFGAVAQFALSALKSLQNVLAPPDQYHLYTTATRALMTARRRGENKSVEYWSGRPIISISIAPLPLIRLPIEKPMSALQPRTLDATPILLTGATDPFLYNPRRAVGHGQTLVVQNEVLEFVLMLQNPFVFDLEIQSFRLSTSGVKFEAKPVRIMIPARSYHRVSVFGKAVETGSLLIRGCTVQAPGGVPREFVLPLASDEEEERIMRQRSALECEIGRFKYPGLDSFMKDQGQKRVSLKPSVSKSPVRFLECKVVPEQPMLRIRRTSVTHGALMLYNGEMSTIRLTFENVSNIPVDFLHLAFDDSTIAPAQQALAEGELSVFETYETEYGLIHTPMFSWDKGEGKSILPGQKLTVSIQCYGKVGCSSGTIHASYSYVHRPSLPQQVFHTRQLSYPLMISVYHMLECHGMDILAFPAYTAESSDSNDAGPDEERRTILHIGGDEAGWCLFSIDIRNTYGTSFDVTIERIQKGTPNAKATRTVPPGSTSRMLMPIRKFLLDDAHISQQIPTLSDRQFVVAKSNLSSAEEKAQRELFWYREELFKGIRCRWVEAGGTRYGDLSLRQQRMTLPMLETLRTEAALVHLSLLRYDNTSTSPVLHQFGKFYPPPHEFVYLRTHVTNMSSVSLIFMLDLSMEPSEHIIYEGVLSNIPFGRLDPGESHTIETALCFLTLGRFDVAANVRTLSVPSLENGRGSGHLAAVVREEG